MSGTTSCSKARPVVFTAGLPAICAVWLSLLESGGADVLMASTAYGGSSQLTDIVQKLNPTQFTKSTFDITGQNDISKAIQTALDRLVQSAKCPTTVLFVEIPTNPDMKVMFMFTKPKKVDKGAGRPSPLPCFTNRCFFFVILLPGSQHARTCANARALPRGDEA
jgi:hypothetical protein